MQIDIRNIVFACPDPPALAEFYAELLGWQIIRRDWLVVAKDGDTLPRLAFGDGPGEYRPPRWPDPEHPQQMHLDFPAADLQLAEEHALRLGATRLQDRGEFRSYADPAGHPFCVYLSQRPETRSAGPIESRVGLIVYDCFSPRALASFYQELMQMPIRSQDTETWVTIGREDATTPPLAFQHVQSPAPRWPDPAYPQQLHLDLHVDDSQAAEDLARRLGAIRLADLGGSCPVYADPAAHPFCLCTSGQ